jgi:RHS repeat-associated protein
MLENGYYVNDMVRTQAQDGVSKGWLLDVLQSRQRASIPNGPNQEVLHYTDGSDAPAWTAQTTAGTETSWTRQIEGIAGDLVASYDSQTATTTLQLQNLHGDIVATASISTTASGPTATFESDEYGNPTTPTSRRYQWLGAKQRRTVIASGVIQMGVRSYVPNTGRFTSTDPVPGGSANGYDYTNADPINNTDVDGRYPGSRLKWAEKVFCIRPWNYSRCRTARHLADRAADATAKTYGARRAKIQDGRADAFRHCYWAALMTWCLGASFAKEIGDRHEAFAGNKDRRMDLRNNFLGRRIAMNRSTGLHRAARGAGACVHKARPGGALIVTNT